MEEEWLIGRGGGGGLPSPASPILRLSKGKHLFNVCLAWCRPRRLCALLLVFFISLPVPLPVCSLLLTASCQCSLFTFPINRCLSCTTSSLSFRISLSCLSLITILKLWTTSFAFPSAFCSINSPLLPSLCCFFFSFPPLSQSLTISLSFSVPSNFTIACY